MANPVVHWEFWSEDPNRCGEFYANVFGWETRDIPGMDYKIVDKGDDCGIGGGIMKPQQGPWPAKMTMYIDVDDLDAYGGKVRSAGGKLVVEKMAVPNVGEFTLFEDPDGRLMGMWKREASQG
jgi:uncharacterized protein